MCGRSDPIMSIRREVPPDSAVRNNNSARRNIRLLRIEPSPDNTEPIAPAGLLRFAEFAVAPAWVGSIPILASEAVSDVDHLLGLRGVLGQQRRQLARRDDQEHGQHDQRPVDDHDQRQDGRPTRPPLAHQPGLDRIHGDHDDQRQHQRPHQPGHGADSGHGDHHRGRRQQDDQRPRDRGPGAG